MAHPAFTEACPTAAATAVTDQKRMPCGIWEQIFGNREQAPPVMLEVIPARADLASAASGQWVSGLYGATSKRS